MDKPWKVILALIGVFVAGAIFGGLLSLRIGRQILASRPPPAALPVVSGPVASPAAPPANQTAQPNPQTVQNVQLMRRLTNQINLTRGQRERVAPAIERAVQDFWHHQQNYNRENAFILQRLKQDIGKELTAEQQSRLDELWSKQMEIFRKRQAEARAQTRGQPPPGPNPAPAPEEKSAPADAAKERAPAAKPPGGS